MFVSSLDSKSLLPEFMQRRERIFVGPEIVFQECVSSVGLIKKMSDCAVFIWQRRPEFRNCRFQFPELGTHSLHFGLILSVAHVPRKCRAHTIDERTEPRTAAGNFLPRLIVIAPLVHHTRSSEEGCELDENFMIRVYGKELPARRAWRVHVDSDSKWPLLLDGVSVTISESPI
jgi:hypothetical protein